MSVPFGFEQASDIILGSSTSLEPGSSATSAFRSAAAAGIGTSIAVSINRNILHEKFNKQFNVLANKERILIGRRDALAGAIRLKLNILSFDLNFTKGKLRALHERLNFNQKFNKN